MKKYLIIGSDCFMRGIMDLSKYPFKRIPGPIDNCKLLNPMGIDYILSGEYLEDIKDKNFQFQETKIESHLGNFIFKDKIRVEHNDATSESFLKNSIIRIDNFKNNIFNQDVTLVMSLNNNISKKVQEFQELFKKYPSLERAIFVALPWENIENLDFFNSYNLLDAKEKYKIILGLKKLGS
jgi:hypothetical protein